MLILIQWVKGVIRKSTRTGRPTEADITVFYTIFQSANYCDVSGVLGRLSGPILLFFPIEMYESLLLILHEAILKN